MDSRYDILVVGSEIPGLVAAGLLARKGYGVGVISDHEGPSVIEKKGFRFNDRPAFITGLLDGPFAPLLETLKIQEKVGTSRPVSYQVVLPDERIDIFRDAVSFDEEMRRCFPAEAKKAALFYQYLSNFENEVRRGVELNPFSFHFLLPSLIRKGKGRLDRCIDSHGLSRRFKAFILAQVKAFSYLHGDSSVLAASSLLGSARRGVFHVEGGIDAMSGLLSRKISALDGEVLKGTPKEILKNGERWLVRTPKEAFSGKIVIGNTDVSSFCSLFMDKGGRYCNKVKDMERSHHTLMVHIGIRSEGVPVGMADNVIVLRDYEREPVSDNLLAIHLSPTVEGKRCMTVRCQIPKGEYSKEQLREISERMLEGVDSLFPFIDRHVEVVTMRYREDARDAVFTSRRRQRMGIGGLPHQVIGGQVYYAGREVFPALGFDGLVYSGELAAASIINALEKRNK